MVTMRDRDGWEVAFVSVDSDFTKKKKNLVVLCLFGCSVSAVLFSDSESLSGFYYVFCLKVSQAILF